MMRHHIHFGLSAVHNDVLFHWLMVAYANSIIVVNETGVSHRRHLIAKQLTRLENNRTCTIIDDIGLVHRRLVSMHDWEKIKPLLKKFTEIILSWIKSRFYLSIGWVKRVAELEKCIQSDSPYACVQYVSDVKGFTKTDRQLLY